MNGLIPSSATLQRRKVAKKIHMRFMGRIYKEHETGGAYLVGYKIYFGNPDGSREYTSEVDSNWHAFSTAEAGKAWINKQAREITGKRVSPKWYSERHDNYHQTDVLYTTPITRIKRYEHLVGETNG